MKKYALAIDLGASSGRHILGSIENGVMTLEEIYRFPNGYAEKNGRFCWDVEALWGHVLAGMEECRKRNKLPATVGVDTWGVDYVLLDAKGQRVSDAVAYRDQRTQSVLDRLDDRDVFRRTGIAKQPFNTLYQLMAEEGFAAGERCLFMPDYFHYLLSGVACNELTEASTSSLLDAGSQTWDGALLASAGIPLSLFPEPPRAPGTILGSLRSGIAERVGFDCRVILPASHDTGSAFAAVPARDERAVYLSSGTWSLLGTEMDAPILSEEARRAGFTNEIGWQGKIRFLKNIMGLWILQCIRHELDDRYSFEQLAQLALTSDYPFTVDMTDQRFLAPQNMTREIRAAAKESGYPEPRTLPDLTLCVCRSLARCYAQSIRELEGITGKRFTSVNIVGGGCNNRTLNQLTADETGLPVYAGPSEGSALGNVLVQMIASGWIRDLAQGRQIVKRSFPVEAYRPRQQ